MTDTRSLSSPRRLAIVLVGAAIALAAIASPPWAAPAPLHGRVIHARASRVYVVLDDSSSVAARDRVLFRLRGRDVAAGEVTAVVEGDLVLVRLKEGSLDRVRKLDRLEVLAERAPLPARASLRIGYPSAARTHLLFACERVDFLPAGGYLSRTAGEHEVRAVRDLAVPLSAPWPDTLVARFFDDPNDEEIALERGEIDAAVFWPGELSRHAREQSRWQGHLWGTRSRGFVAARGLGPAGHDSIAVAPEPATLERLNRELFRGDLRIAPADPLRGRPYGPLRFEADLAFPGFREIQRLLDSMAPATARRVTLTVVDRPWAAADPRDDLTPLFLLRCPVVSSAELRPYLAALGSDAVVDALDCRMRARP